MHKPHFSSIVNKLPFKGERKILMKNQGVSDIITGILATHKMHREEYDRISDQFNAPTAREVGQKVYDFLAKNTKYRVEPDSRQTLRGPGAILRIGATDAGLDCKSYSLFIGGVLDSLNRKGHNIPWAYRFASYRPFDKTPHHVFVVANPKTNNEIWLLTNTTIKNHTSIR